METVGRFAPSPSGRLHLGNLLCALLVWLSARQKDGRVLLRVEDLDTARCPRRYSEQMERGSPMAGAGLGHRPRKGQRHRPLLPEPADGDLPSGTGNAAGKGPCLSLLLYPGGDSRCLRSSPGGRAGGLCRDLPPSHRGGDRGKKQKSRPGPPADNAGGALGLYRRPHGPIRGKSGRQTAGIFCCGGPTGCSPTSWLWWWMMPPWA